MMQATRRMLLPTVVLLASAGAQAQTQTQPPFAVEEATIAGVHAAMRGGQLTCRALVDAYLARIAAYDKNGPAVNAIVMINPDARREADELDRRFAAGGLTGPLHCVPMIVKDNFETAGLQTSNGALAFAGYRPARDATQVARVKAAGAIVLAKSNMAEWAFSPVETVSSILPGYTRNPYALDRVTAGSSGGTAAAIAASFGLVGLGSDTGDSIRGPSSHTGLAGIRSTMGLTSRAGVFPLNLKADIAGPMARSVADMAAVFQVIVGEDPRDSVTATARDHALPDLAATLARSSLKGVRIGVLREAWERETTDPEIRAIFMAALDDLRRQGAIIVDPAPIEGYAPLVRPGPAGPCMGFKHDLNRFLAQRAGQVPLADLTAIIASGRFHPSVAKRLEDAEKGPVNGAGSAACQEDDAQRAAVRAQVLGTMARLKLDAYVYPTWSNPPRLIGDLNTPGGDNSQIFAPLTGFPAVNMPMGHSRGGLLPIGITFFGRPWADAALIGYAHAYEQATRHRHPPASTPPLR
ncbi:amidase [Sandarakinorhabdus oryzae]|uniref:amidase n=1 Tax=Sandarakinorhabdus oryzae TaxID=2675220 RepID=UPI0018CC2834|nr:amidase family protein [Sandarakinorhabdus oryzae]